MRDYERLRGQKKELTTELMRMRTNDLEQHIAFEQKVDEAQASVARDDKTANEH